MLVHAIEPEFFQGGTASHRYVIGEGQILLAVNRLDADTLGGEQLDLAGGLDILRKGEAVRDGVHRHHMGAGVAGRRVSDRLERILQLAAGFGIEVIDPFLRGDERSAVGERAHIASIRGTCRSSVRIIGGHILDEPGRRLVIREVDGEELAVDFRAGCGGPGGLDYFGMLQGESDIVVNGTSRLVARIRNFLGRSVREEHDHLVPVRAAVTVERGHVRLGLLVLEQFPRQEDGTLFATLTFCPSEQLRPMTAPF